VSALVILGILLSSPWHWFEPEIDFNAQIRPIINTKCIACHGGVKQAGGFSLLFREDALGNTESGKPAIVPGNPGKSELIKRLTHHDPELRMPLEKEPLSEQEIDLLKTWIRQGAKWEDHWAFIKPAPVEVPTVENTGFVKNEIDRFILKKLNEQQLQPSPEADKATLLRRVSLDLSGLPPTMKELDEFIKDNSPNAYEKVVDRLLQSQAYGERWAAMWLDLARYADTKGYEKDQHRNIWRYRDYLIKSFNEDKPYDQFTIEQLAGDLLPNPTDEQIIATAFHRNTMNNDEGGTDDEEFRTAEVIDRVNTTFDVWQGITMSCVQCHSHPYDPIRQKEYYSFMAFLNNTKDSDSPDEAPVFAVEKDYDLEKADKLIRQIHLLKGGESINQVLDLKAKRRKYLLPTVNAVDLDESSQIEIDEAKIKPIQAGAYLAYHNMNLSNVEKIGCSYIVEKGCKVEVRMDKPDGPLLATLNLSTTFGEWYDKSEAIKPVKGTHSIYFVFNKTDKGTCDGRFRNFSFREHPLKDKKKKSALDSLRNELVKAIDPKGTPVLIELPAEKARVTQMFVRGNWQDKADTVDRGTPQILNPFPQKAPKNRLGMAQWLVAEDNPLTARVAVNRFWEQTFGYGIIETLEDFGSQGNKPSHPELLDWLALKFAKDYKWSMKKLLKLIVMSGTYRQSSEVKPEYLEKDPMNRYLARAPRVRLSAEQVRDQALAVGGILSSKMYGPSVMPHQPKNVWQTVYSGMEWKISEGEDRNRRAVYTYMRRTSPYPGMVTFDSPSREVCVARRIRTNTPLQSLITLNDTTFIEASIGLAHRMAEAAEDTPYQLREGFKMAIMRYPEQEELQKLVKLHTEAQKYYTSNKGEAALMVGEKKDAEKLAPLAVVANAIINLDEFITKE
jgi:hypothetical protein